MKSSFLPLRVTPLFVSVLLPFALGGCGHKDTITGKWQIAVTQPTSSVSTIIEFTPDGKEIITGQSVNRGVTTNDTVSGTYTVNGTSLNQNLTTMTRDGRDVPLPPNLTRTGPFTLDGDHLTFVDPSSNMSRMLTRVK